MLKVTLIFVPPGGGETDYVRDYAMPALPRPGDYISIEDEEEPGRQLNFIVRRTWWQLEGAKERVGKVSEISVECEFARSPFSSTSHKRACDMYDHSAKEYGKNQPVPEFENSCY